MPLLLKKSEAGRKFLLLLFEKDGKDIHHVAVSTAQKSADLKVMVSISSSGAVVDDQGNLYGTVETLVGR